MGDEGAAFLSEITSLKDLNLDNVFSWGQSIPGRITIGPIGAAHISKLQNLNNLSLSICVYNEGEQNLGDEGAKMISKLQNLKSLNICRTSTYLDKNSIGSEGMSALCHGLVKLETVTLCRPSIN